MQEKFFLINQVVQPIPILIHQHFLKAFHIRKKSNLCDNALEYTPCFTIPSRHKINMFLYDLRNFFPSVLILFRNSIPPQSAFVHHTAIITANCHRNVTSASFLKNFTQESICQGAFRPKDEIPRKTKMIRTKFFSVTVDM